MKAFLISIRKCDTIFHRPTTEQRRSLLGSTKICRCLLSPAKGIMNGYLNGKNRGIWRSCPNELLDWSYSIGAGAVKNLYLYGKDRCF